MMRKIPRGPLLRRQPHRLPANVRLTPALRMLPEENQSPAGSSGVRDSAAAAVEAVLILADEPVHPRRLATLTGLTDAQVVRKLIRQLRDAYRDDGSAFQIEELAGGYQLLTRPEFNRWLVRLRRTHQETRLTTAARETLAIIAYRQPIMRADIEAIRGVQCGEMLRHLMEKGLVRITGRHASLGRPVLYGTTRRFLQVFGLRSLRDLPETQSPRSVEGTVGPSSEATPSC